MQVCEQCTSKNLCTSKNSYHKNNPISPECSHSGLEICCNIFLASSYLFSLIPSTSVTCLPVWQWCFINTRMFHPQKHPSICVFSTFHLYSETYPIANLTTLEGKTNPNELVSHTMWRVVVPCHSNGIMGHMAACSNTEDLLGGIKFEGM